MKLEVLIDGYNLMGWFGLFDLVQEGELTLEEARDKVLEEVLDNPALGGAERIKIRVVFDAQSEGEHYKRGIEKQIIKIFFTKDADIFIKRNSRKEKTVVITRDRPLAESLKKKGVQVCHPEFFFGDGNQKGVS